MAAAFTLLRGSPARNLLARINHTQTSLLFNVRTKSCVPLFTRKNRSFITASSSLQITKKQLVPIAGTSSLSSSSFKHASVFAFQLPYRHMSTTAINSSPSTTQQQQHHEESTTSTKNRSIVGYWLLGTAGMVFAMVVLGGVTRLTRSGLSIVEWRPGGEHYPSTDPEWELAFAEYKKFPEYQRVNSRMSIEEFKPIYFMEWAHRMWGRAIGLAFGLPLVFFGASKMIPLGFGGRLLGLLAVGGTQGAVGWWMVKSGLEHDRFSNEYSIPRVSPYRLATHLGFAWTLYSALLWNAWDLLHVGPNSAAAKALATSSSSSVTRSQQLAALTRLHPWVMTSISILGITIASGAFVAGNDAGHAYNDWPLFAGKVIPEQIWDSSLGARNFTENTATVQFDHRNLAYASVFSVGMIHMACKRVGWLMIPSNVKRAAMILGGLVAAQATLGITTLILYVPVSLGAAHQAGALVLWTGALHMLHSVKTAKALLSSAGVDGAASAAAVVKGSALTPKHTVAGVATMAVATAAVAAANAASN